MNLLSTGLNEVRKTARVTFDEGVRVFTLGSGRLRERRLRRQAAQAQAALGQKVFDEGLGDAGLRAKVMEINDRILSLKAANSSTKALETERTGMYARLAEPYLTQSSPQATEADQGRASAAREALQAQQQLVNATRELLLNEARGSRWRLVAGFGSVALVLLFGLGLLFLLVGFDLFGSKHPSKLVGTWEGKMGIVGGIRLELKKSGRFTYGILEDDGKYSQFRADGEWKVDKVVDGEYKIRIKFDSSPDEVYGWSIAIKDDNKIRVDGYDMGGITFKRK